MQPKNLQTKTPWNDCHILDQLIRRLVSNCKSTFWISSVKRRLKDSLWSNCPHIINQERNKKGWPLVRIPSTPSTCFHQYARWNKAIWLVVVNHLTSLNELESFISAKHCNNMLTLVYDICFWWEVQIPKRIKTSYKLVTLVVLVKGSACGPCGLTIPIRITIKSENLNCASQLHQKGK